MSEREEERQSANFFINTAPEMDALERAAADGKHGRNYLNNEQGNSRHHRAPGASHSVLLELSSSETLAGLTTETLEQFTNEQDADAALAFLYIAHLLAPPMGINSPELANGKIDFDDVIGKIGWDPRSSAERREMHKRIYQFILFGERAQVVGHRRGKYVDKHTKEKINTVIRSALWRILTNETLDQKSLFPDHEVPVRVELVMSREWTQILTSPQTAQYLPMGEVLGSIRGSNTKGAWARVIGLSLASFWRRLPRETLNNSIQPTRRELLERYPPKTGTVESVLNSKDPSHAITHWCNALQILVGIGFVEPIGEAIIPAKEMREKLPRQDWSDEWLNQSVDLRPGILMRTVIESREKALPVAPVPRKRGRPRKTPDQMS